MPETLDKRLKHYVTQGQLNETLAHIDARFAAIEKNITTIGAAQVATQADIDALTTALTAEDSSLQTSIANIQAWINSQPAGPDITALQAIVTQVGTDVANAAALVPAPSPGN